MKLCVLTLLLPFALPAQTPRPPATPPALKPEDLATISGTLLNAITDEPVRAATLRFDSVQSYTATTDAAGKFSLGELPPGRYRLSSDRTGFARPVYSGRNLTGFGSVLDLIRGQKVTGLTLRILPHGVVTGRVTLPDRDPTSGIQVAVMKLSISRDGKTFSISGSAVTNDLGEYRIFGLSAGKYFVAATDRPPVRFPQSAPRSLPAKGEDAFLRTFYPGVTEVSAATPIDVKAGAETRSVDIRLARGRTVVVRGRVIKSDLPEGTNPSTVMLGLRPGRDPIDYFTTHRANFDAAGLFEFVGVTPGSYDLMAMTAQSGKTYSNRMRLEVGEDSLDNVTLTIRPGFTLTGRLRMEKDDDPLTGNPHVRLLAQDSYLLRGQPIDVPVNPDGTFSLLNISPDRYEVQVFPIPLTTYVKAIRAADRDVLLSGLDLLAGGPPQLEIVLSSGASEVSGVVQDAESKPVPNPIVALVLQEPERRASPAAYRTSTAAADGTFRLRGVPPGEYKVYGWEVLDDRPFFDQEFLKPLESKAKLIKVEEGSRQSIQLRSIE